MSTEFISRIVGMVLAIVAAALIGLNITASYGLTWEQQLPYILGISLLCGLIFLFITPYITVKPYRWLRDQISQAAVIDLVAGACGLIVGLIIAALLALPLSQLSFLQLGRILPTIAALFFGYIGASIAVLRKHDIAHLFQGGANLRKGLHNNSDESDGDHSKSGKHKGKNSKSSDSILVDTSAIIDGRIADIAKTGFINSTLVIPRFVLHELQHIADSADSLRRNRGRRGLEILKQMQKDQNVPIEITEAEVEDVQEVDSKLVKLAGTLHCPIITNDFNLNRVAEVQGITVLNINELAHAVKPAVLPGEDMVIKVIQEGKEAGQGVGYLDDGTMIVVEGGSDYLNKDIEILVTRVLQTVAGKMIFGHPKQLPEVSTPTTTTTKKQKGS